MIGVEKLELVIEIALWSWFLKNEKPLSLLIIARPESGKTQLVLKYRGNSPSAVVLTDCTAWGIQRTFLNEMKEGLTHHIVIPDPITPLQRSPSTVSTFIAFFNNLIEEGVVEVHTYAMDFKVEGLNGGLITTITPDILTDGRHKVTRIGFLSRMLPVSYKYSQETAKRILVSIVERDYYKEAPKILPFPKDKQEVYLPKELAAEMVPITESFVSRMDEAEQLYGFRYQKQLQVLLEAHALMKGHNELIREDVEVVKDIVQIIQTREEYVI